ncbi:MAG: uroporphyrinogen-III synthase [Thermodesulfobacteriota bacterium]|nr:uroporphyrinogen-III synthase [Thermodesulfobacteriota bacterium]
MASSSERLFAGKRILVPPARPEANPLLEILRRRGAEAIAFPALKVEAPSDYGPMDQAMLDLSRFDYIVFSGANCVVNFLERLKTLGPGKAALREAKTVAIGHGAVSALNKEAIEIDHRPRIHTADGVAEGFGEISGKSFLLVRVEGASQRLPERLRRMGAEVRDVAGYRMDVLAAEKMADQAFGQTLHALALANPTSVRFFLKGARDLALGLAKVLKEVLMAAVGPATAEAATRHGLAPHIVSKGHIADLAESLTDYFSQV